MLALRRRQVALLAESTLQFVSLSFREEDTTFALLTQTLAVHHVRPFQSVGRFLPFVIVFVVAVTQIIVVLYPGIVAHAAAALTSIENVQITTVVHDVTVGAVRADVVVTRM